VQTVVDDTLDARKSACTVEVPDHPGLLEGTFRKMKFAVPDHPEENREWLACAGLRVFSEAKLISAPSLLILQAMRGTHFGFEHCRWLSLAQTNYHLVAAIFGNDNHFVGCCFISSYCLFYDGMRQTKLQWTHAHSVIPEGYSIAQMWYRKTDEQRDKQAITQDEIAETLMSISQKARGTKTHRTGAKTVGWSFAPAGAAKGVLPKCTACKCSIQRTQARLKNRKLVNPARGWTRIESVHAALECLNKLGTTDRNSFAAHRFEENYNDVKKLQDAILAGFERNK
jgi:hypothetical protein